MDHDALEVELHRMHLNCDVLMELAFELNVDCAVENKLLDIDTVIHNLVAFELESELELVSAVNQHFVFAVRLVSRVDLECLKKYN